MRINTYRMSGSEGALRLTVNNFVIAYAERFVAVLREFYKDYDLRGVRYPIFERCDAEIRLCGLSMPDPDVVNIVVQDLSKGSLSDFAFRGFYKGRNGDLVRIEFCGLVPKFDNLNDFLGGDVDEWEFKINNLPEKTMDEFKKA